MERLTQHDLEIVNKLQEELYRESEILHLVSESIQDDLHNDDPEAQALLSTALRHATNNFREIGFELNAYGGFELMQISIYKISKAGLSIVPIEHAWDGIGEWMV